MKKIMVITLAVTMLALTMTGFAAPKKSSDDVTKVAVTTSATADTELDLEEEEVINNDEEEVIDIDEEEVNDNDDEEINDNDEEEVKDNDEEEVKDNDEEEVKDNDEEEVKDNSDENNDNGRKERKEKGKINKEELEKRKEDRRAARIDAREYIKEIKALFRDADTLTKGEILDEIAAIKKELKDYSIGTFIKGIVVDYDKYDNVEPVLENGRTLVPLRAVLEAFEADLAWEDATEKITITKGDTKIEMQIGSDIAYVNGASVTLDVAPKIKNDRTLVPVRFIAETFNLDVEWDEDSQTVVIE